MMRGRYAVAVALLLSCDPAHGFNTSEHHSATTLAVNTLINQPVPIDQLGSAYPDLSKFQTTIIPWTGGVGLPIPDNTLAAE